MLIIYPTTMETNDIFPEGKVKPALRKLIIQHYGAKYAVLRLFFETKRRVMAHGGIGLSRVAVISHRLLGEANIRLRSDDIPVEEHFFDEFTGLDQMPAPLYSFFWRVDAIIDDVIDALEQQNGCKLSLGDLINIKSYYNNEEIVDIVAKHIRDKWSAGDIITAFDNFYIEFSYSKAIAWNHGAHRQLMMA